MKSWIASNADSLDSITFWTILLAWFSCFICGAVYLENVAKMFFTLGLAAWTVNIKLEDIELESIQDSVSRG